ncbi:MAG: type II toxin-antitoxin system Phd/YefM family antitoxin [Armatimonadota bacterium]|nr:type II toxin-antitoxin system Phd/YefM family antitoxin [Armatimonadota bacterium]
MKALSVSKAKEILSKLVGEVASEHEPVLIRGKKTTAVLLDQDDWRAIQETLYILSIPDMRESIREGLETPVDQCSEELSW